MMLLTKGLHPALMGCCPEPLLCICRQSFQQRTGHEGAWAPLVMLAAHRLRTSCRLSLRMVGSLLACSKRLSSTCAVVSLSAPAGRAGKSSGWIWWWGLPTALLALSVGLQSAIILDVGLPMRDALPFPGAAINGAGVHFWMANCTRGVRVVHCKH